MGMLLLLPLSMSRTKRLIVCMLLMGSSVNRWISELLMLLLLLLLLLLWVRTWLLDSSERVGRELRVHVDGIVRAILHVCGIVV